LNGAEISHILGLRASRILEANAPIPGAVVLSTPRRLARANRWEYLISDGDRDLVHLFSQLEATMSPIRHLLHQLSEAAIIRVEVEISLPAGLAIPHTLVRLIADCGGAIDIDISS
jgi:hypothetical protein